PAGDAAVVDDAAGALLTHIRGGMFHAEHHAAHQRRHRGVEALNLEAFDAAGLRGTAGIVEQAIDAAEFFYRKGDQRLHLRFHRDVGLAEDAVGAKPCRQRLALWRAPPGDDDLRAFGDKYLRGAQSDAARRTGYYRYLAIQPSHVIPPSKSVDAIFPPLADKASGRFHYDIPTGDQPCCHRLPRNPPFSVCSAIFWIR